MIGFGVDVAGIADGDDVVFGSVDEEPWDFDFGGAIDDGADFAHVIHVGLGEGAVGVVPHEAFAWFDHAEFAFGEFLGVHHAGEGNQKLDAGIACGTEDTDGSAHAVADVTDARIANIIEHRAEVFDFFGDGGIDEAAAGSAVAGERKTKGVEAVFGEFFGEGDDEGAVFVASDAMAQNDDGVGFLAAGVERVVEGFALFVLNFSKHNGPGGDGFPWVGRDWQ